MREGATAAADGEKALRRWVREAFPVLNENLVACEIVYYDFQRPEEWRERTKKRDQQTERVETMQEKEKLQLTEC